MTSTPVIGCICLRVILMFILPILTVPAGLISNPETAPGDCGLSAPGYICDSQSVFEESRRNQIAKALESFNNNNPCGQCLGVVVIPKIPEATSKDVAHRETKAAAQKLTDGSWSFSKCRYLAVIIMNTGQRYVWLQPGKGTKLCSKIDTVFADNVALFKAKKYGEGISGMISTYVKGFKAKYQSTSTCSEDSFPCSDSTPSNAYDLEDLLGLLPNPMTASPSKCKIESQGFICDPQGLLSNAQREEVRRALESVNSNKCKQCVMVAVLKSGSNKPDTMKRLAIQILQNRWTSKDCKARILILIAKDVNFLWLQGTAETMQCQKLQTIYQENKKYFIGGDVYNGIKSIVDSYGRAITSTKSCTSDLCKSLGGGKNGKGNSLSGIGGTAGKKALDYAKKNKKVVIIVVVCLIIALGCFLCAGCICCREKMMGFMKSAGSTIASKGPGMMSGLRGGGNAGAATGGGQAAWGAGGVWASTGEKNAGAGGAGGTWEESELKETPPNHVPSSSPSTQGGNHPINPSNQGGAGGAF